MPWIIFERGEPRAPALRLPTLDGSIFDTESLRGEFASLLFFMPRQDCPACWELVQQLAAAAAEMHGQGVEPLVVLPQRPQPPERLPDGLTWLLDEQGAAGDAYHAILEFDTTDQPLLFILNRFGVPFRAWVEPEPDPHEIMQRVLKYIDAAALLCPE